MRSMPRTYGRDLDLNLLRVFAVVADAGSVTEAAARLYLTQPAVSAALKRLATAVGAPLFVRQGRGLALTGRGDRLAAQVRPLLEGLVGAALAPAAFDPATSDRAVRVGVSDAAESWLLPQLVRSLERDAPSMKIVVLPVQFRTVAEALALRRVDVALTVADEVPAGTRREAVGASGFVCLYDPARVKLPRKLTMRQYLARDHVIVSYNGDMRGVVEDVLGIERRVRCSVPTFHAVGPLVEGSRRLATVPEAVARWILLQHRRLRTAALPFQLGGQPLELLWREAVDDDGACRFVRERMAHLVRQYMPPQADQRPLPLRP